MGKAAVASDGGFLCRVRNRLSCPARLWIYNVRQLENRQEHADNHAADHDSQKHDKDRLDQRSESRERGFNFFIQKVRNTLKHVVYLAGLLAGGDHADDHHRKNRVLAERAGNAFATFDVQSGDFDRLFHDDVADSLGDDLKDFENGNTTADERGQRAGETGEADFVGDGAENRELDAPRIPEFAARFRLDEIEPPVNAAAGGQKDEDEVFFDRFAQAHQELRRSGEFGAKAGVNLAEDGNDLHEQENGDENCHHRDDGGIHHGRFDLFAQACRVFQIDREPGENLSEQPPFFAGADHGNIKPGKGLGVFGKSVREVIAAFNAGGDV